jgi:hypothetical protein
MLDDEQLLLVVRDALPQGQKVPVLLLLSHVHQPAQTISIRNKAVEIGFRVATQWNLSAVLKVAANDGLVAQLKAGWKLLHPGLNAISKFYQPEAPIIRETRHSLKIHVGRISDTNRRAFVEEAIRCFDVRAYRSAVVLSWVGAAHILQEHIVQNHLAAFNAAGLARAAKANPKSSASNFIPIKSTKDFGVIGEADMLQLCQDAGILHKAEKKLLQDRLDLRNQCGHPNPLEIAEHTVAFHLESLMLNVFSRY